MRLLAAILIIGLCQPAVSQQLNLTSVQHELRWLDEMHFPPLIKDSMVSNQLLEYTVSALSRKFRNDSSTIPRQVNYRKIDMFGKPRLMEPAKSPNPEDYQASVLSLITRATTGFEVFWQMKVEVQQHGKTVYSRETKHQLLNYEQGISWFDESSFMEHFSVLVDELLELRPALPEKYVLGNGVDHAQVLRDQGHNWKVDKNGTPIGFGKPSFGPYVTLDAGKQDTAVIRSSTYRGKESSIGSDGGRLFFDQFKTYDYSKTKFCFLKLGNDQDTLEASYAVLVRGVESRRTFLSNLLSNNDETGSNSSGYSRRNIEGMIRTDSMTWSFVLDGYGSDGTINGGHLSNDQAYFRIFYRQHAGYHWEIITQNDQGEYLASLEFRTSGPELHLLKKLDKQSVDAIAVMYAVMMSARNVQ